MPIDFARNAATQIGTTVFRKVAGDLNGVISGSEGGSGDSSSPAAPLERTKFSTKNLAFPLDLQSGDPGLGNHGHYMMFFINQNNPSELSFGGNEQNGADNEKKAKSEYGIQNPKSNKSSSYYEPKK